MVSLSLFLLIPRINLYIVNSFLIIDPSIACASIKHYVNRIAIADDAINACRWADVEHTVCDSSLKNPM